MRDFGILPPLREEIDLGLREAIERARVRYGAATNHFLEVLSPMPKDLPYQDWVKRMEKVAVERRKAMKELLEAVRRWSEFSTTGIEPEFEDG